MSKKNVKRKAASFVLEPDGFSIHTFEFSRKITGYEYHDIKETLYQWQNKCDDKGWMYKDKKSENHVCTCYHNLDLPLYKILTSGYNRASDRSIGLLECTSEKRRKQND